MSAIVIIKAGHTLPELAARRGDFDDWISEGMAPGPIPVSVVDPVAGDALPDPGTCRAAVVTGSSAMVTDRAPWSERLGAWMRSLALAETPLLGICYGHQLLADALGGEVGTNAHGREIGTVRIDLDAAGDDLLGDLPDTITVQETHRQSVLALPPGGVRLGGNAVDANQAFRAGPRAWGVQFHPEFDADVMRTYLLDRREELAEEGLDPDALLRECRDAPHGAAILARFGEIVRG